jgi:hypothetical protein
MFSMNYAALPKFDTLLEINKIDANLNMTFACLCIIFPCAIEETISSLLLFDTVSTTFVPGKISSEKIEVRAYSQTWGF